MDIEPAWVVESLPDASSKSAASNSLHHVRWEPFPLLDSMRLEEEHRDERMDDGKVLVYGRKYVVDVKQMLMMPLYWSDEVESRRVRRVTYFVKSQGGQWFPYDTEDANLVEVSM
ncbi:unnamed protein product [Choristocarpus tenellus]